MTHRDFDPKDFIQFKEGMVFPPTEVSENIIQHIHQELNPSSWKVFAKLAFIHFCCGILTLSICPQFGFRVFGSGPGLMNFFMALGPYGCMLACGSFFMGATILVASFILRPEELRQLKKNSFLEVGSLVLLSMGFFIMAGAAEVMTGFAMAWLLGSIVSGMALIELGFFLRKFALKIQV